MAGRARLGAKGTNRNSGQIKTHMALGTGLGAGADYSSVVGLLREACTCPIYALPTVAKRQVEITGPLTPDQSKNFIGDTIDILSSSFDAPGGPFISYETTGFIKGEFQTHVLACAIGWHMEPWPWTFTARGLAFNKPDTHSVKGFTPDVFTQLDQLNLWGALANAPQGRATLNYGKWLNLAFWAIVRGYNLRWSYGSLFNILDEQLRDTAFMPTNAQDGSASSSEIDVGEWVAEVNNHYLQELGSDFIFQMIDTVRLGSVCTAASCVSDPCPQGVNLAPGTGRFSPNDDFRTVGITFGGTDLRSMLKGNSEFRTLSAPYMLKAGVPVGLFLQAENEDMTTLARTQLSAGGFGADGQSAVPGPAVFTDSPGRVDPGFGTSFPERTLDSGGFDACQKVLSEEYEWKGGRGFMSTEIKGWEITEKLYDMIKNDDLLQAQLCSECGLMIATSS
jgi:hypothetical protein